MAKRSKPQHRRPARSNRAAAVAVLLALALSGVVASAAAQGDSQGSRVEPLLLQSQGSFFIGGEDRQTDALNSRAPSAGTVTVNQMYVQYQVPVPYPGYLNKAAVIMVHGCCLSAKSFEETPDGRMGWNEYFVRHGHPTYLPDQVSRARSGFDATVFNEIALGLDGKTAKDIPYI